MERYRPYPLLRLLSGAGLVFALFAVCGHGQGHVCASLLPGALLCDLDDGVCGRLVYETVGEEGPED